MIRIFFGNIGCGKTTNAVRNIVKDQKKRRKGRYAAHYTNFETDVSIEVNLRGLGTWTLPQGTHLTIDEAGIEYNNRAYKTLPHSVIEWFKLSRHYGVDCDFYSQSWEDTDITMLRLASEYWHLRRIGPFTYARKVRKFVFVEKEKKQIQYGYEYCGLLDNLKPWKLNSWYIFLRKPYYKYFDSFSVPEGVPVRYPYPGYEPDQPSDPPVDPDDLVATL